MPSGALTTDLLSGQVAMLLDIIASVLASGDSRRVIAEHLGHLDASTLERVLSRNAAGLYGLDLDHLARVRDAAA